VAHAVRGQVRATGTIEASTGVVAVHTACAVAAARQAHERVEIGIRQRRAVGCGHAKRGARAGEEASKGVARGAVRGERARARATLEQ
jgi:hypothetical protein